MAWLRNTNGGRTEPSAEEWWETGHDSQDDPHRPYSPPQINSLEDHSDVVDDYSQFPRNKAYGSPKKAEEFPPKEHLKGAPLNSAARMKPSPFSRNDDHSHTDDDDYDRHGGYEGSHSPKIVRTKPERDTDYGRESPKGAGRKPSFVPLAGRRQQYTAPVSTSPKKDTNHETARNRPIGNSPPRSKPETDTQFPKAGGNPSFGSPASNNTAHDNGKGKTFEPKYQPQVSPRPMTLPRKEDPQETIDSSEACKRYGGKAINQPKREEKRTISCKEAARKYDGTFV